MLRVGGLVCRTAQGDVLNVMGAIFVSAMFLGTSNSSTVQPVFAIERSVMYRCAPHQLVVARQAPSNALGHWHFEHYLIPQACPCFFCGLSGVVHAEGSASLKDADACVLWPERGRPGCMR